MMSSLLDVISSEDRIIYVAVLFFKNNVIKDKKACGIDPD